MDPSKVAGAVAKGSASEGPALAQASADGEDPEKDYSTAWKMLF